MLKNKLLVYLIKSNIKIRGCFNLWISNCKKDEMADPLLQAALHYRSE